MRLRTVIFCLTILVFLLSFGAPGTARSASLPYVVVDTGQESCSTASSWVSCPASGTRFSGQDAQYMGNAPKYRDNGDGTVTDLNTGLMWVKARGVKTTWNAAASGAAKCRVGGYPDWRMPTIKELYSLIDFNGYVHGGTNSVPFLDTAYFDFKYGDTGRGERNIDCQDWSATTYQGTTMGRNHTAFGVNFADGRIKGYGKTSPHGASRKYVRYVRGNPAYGKNDFNDNHDGTVTDRATSLVWEKGDSGKGMNWESALGYCESLDLAGTLDWRLPNAKELQSIVDYTRGPASTGVPAVDPVFFVTEPESYYWSSTTHYDGPKERASSHAAYVAFGRAMGKMHGREMDVHGAGAQRSDPKAWSRSEVPFNRGPQGDEVRVYNYVRCVRGGVAEPYAPPASERVPESVAEADGSGQGQGMGQGGGQRSGHMRPGSKRGGMGQGPPQEAFDACSGSSSGDTCTVNTPHGELSGTCGDSPEGMVCRPQGGGPGMRPGIG